MLHRSLQSPCQTHEQTALDICVPHAWEEKRGESRPLLPSPALWSAYRHLCCLRGSPQDVRRATGSPSGGASSPRKVLCHEEASHGKERASPRLASSCGSARSAVYALDSSGQYLTHRFAFFLLWAFASLLAMSLNTGTQCPLRPATADAVRWMYLGALCPLPTNWRGQPARPQPTQACDVWACVKSVSGRLLPSSKEACRSPRPPNFCGSPG